MMIVAVVPIFVQAGAAALPTILAAAATLLALLFRPAEWIRLGRKNPPAVAGLIASIFLAIWGASALGHRKVSRVPVRTDWAQVALQIIRREQTVPTTRIEDTVVPRSLQPAWEFKQPGTSFLSSPALADDRLYGASCQVDVAGTFGSIFCLNARNGQLVWQVEKIDGQDLKAFFSSPALTADGKYLVIGEGLHFDSECRLICLEAATGKLHWKIDVPKNHVESSPAIVGNLVVAGAGAIERDNHLPVEAKGYVLGVRVSDGKVLWNQAVIDPESSPAMTPDGVAYIGSGINGNALVALRTASDEALREKQLDRVVWQTPTPYPATGDAALGGDLVLIGTGRGDFVNAAPEPAGAVLACERSTGNVRWKTEFGDAVLGRLAVGDGKVICPVRNGTVVALDLKYGTKLWSQSFSHAPVLAGVTLHGDAVYAVSSDGFLAILDAATGRLLEKRALNDEAEPGRQNLCFSSPRVANGRVFVGSETGGLRCFVGTSDR